MPIPGLELVPQSPPPEFGHQAFVLVFLLILKTVLVPDSIKKLMTSLDRHPHIEEQRTIWRGFIDKLKFCEALIKTGAWVTNEW